MMQHHYLKTRATGRRHHHHDISSTSSEMFTDDDERDSDMQGVVFMTQNPQQGSPPPTNPIASGEAAMDTVPESPKLNQTDSGIFTSNDSGDNRSDCSSPAADDQRKYVCPICDTMLTSQHDFTLHIRSHNNHENGDVPDSKQGGFTCRICLKILSSSSSLDRHVLVHSGERPFHCKYCGDTFTTNGNMHRHMRTHSSHKNESYESDGSEASNASESSKSTEYNNNKIELVVKKRKLSVGEEQEGRAVKKINDAEDEGSNHGQKYGCPVCDRTDFDSMVELETHVEDNHPDCPVKCGLCQQVFQNNKLLMAHKGTVHGSGGGVNNNNNSKHHVMTGFKDLTFVDFSSHKFPHIARYECEKNLHKVSSTGGLKFQCKRCSRAFPCASSLDYHEKDCSQRLDLTKAQSEIRSSDIRRSEFFSRLDLLDNSPEKIIVDTTSNKLREQLLAKAMTIADSKDLADIQSIISMTTNGSLLHQLQTKDHIPQLNNKMLPDTNHDKAEQQDEESQDLFAVEFRKMKLRGEFPCRLCTAVFPNLRALKGHNRAHLNGNNNGMYRCNMCPHSSMDKAALIRHMRTHNGDRPYECSLCNYAFTTKANCERHLRNRHAKTTREDVKKSIIYHPSEDPTNGDLNKLTVTSITKKTSEDLLSPIPNKLTTPELRNTIVPGEINKPEVMATLIPTLLKEKETPKFSGSNINDIIRSENLKSLKEHKIQHNGPVSPYLHCYNFSPKSSNISTPNLSAKIQVKNLETLRAATPPTLYQSSSDEEEEEEEDEPEMPEDEPMNLVLDLSKKSKGCDERKNNTHQPEDLSNKNAMLSPQQHHQQLMGEVFAQHLLKTPPKIDPAALYATQLALCRNPFPGFPNWPSFPLNPLLFQSLQGPVLPPHAQEQEMKERLQRYQLCGGSFIAGGENFPNLQQHNYRGQFPNMWPENASTNNIMNNKDVGPPPRNICDSPSSKISHRDNLTKPLSLNVESESFSKVPHSPVIQHQTPPKQDNMMIQSPNSVKMVIKNGVLMPKQKQRRYRTERPFTCEHCSARFTLRSNMERHIKQQHPQYWSQRQRGLNTPGRKSQLKSTFCDLSIPNYDIPKTITDDVNTKDNLEEKLKFALLAQHLQASNLMDAKKEEEEEEDDGELIIDENEDKTEDRMIGGNNNVINHHKNTNGEFDERRALLEDKLKELHGKHGARHRGEENQDLVPVSRLLDNASQQPFKDYFKREAEEHEVSEEDEEGLVASGSTSEGNISGNEENRSESETSTAPVKKKSAYSMAPNRVSCPFCSRKFPWSSSLRRHILTHTGQKPFKCSHCPLLFTTKSNCDRHLLRKHGNNATTITNTADSSGTTSANYLMRNVPERPFKCSNCPSSTFSTYSNLKKHISCKHATNAQGDDIRAQGYEAGSSEDEKVVSVNKTEWNLPSYNNNNTTPSSGSKDNSAEVVVSNSDLPFKCHLCEGSFSDRQDALDHIKDRHYSEYELLMSKNALDSSATTPEEGSTHQNDDDESDLRGKFPDYSNRKVICAFCMRRFWSAEDLRRHMRTHTGERPFSCDICRRRFTLKHSMLRHRKKHNVNFDSSENVNNSDEDNFEQSGSKFKAGQSREHYREESDGNEGGSDLISNLLGIGDRSFIDKVLTATPDDAAKLLGVKNGGVKE